MSKDTSFSHWFELWEIFEQYRGARRTVTDEFIASVNFGAVGQLPFQIRKVLTYMQNIEDAVWGVYFRELSRTPTGRNPVIGKFLENWLEEERRHAALLEQVLEAAGGAVPGKLMQPWDTSWVARIMGENLFGGVHMAMGATNELMTSFAYKTLAKIVRREHPELARVLIAIATEESMHYAFYYRVARVYLGQSRRARWVAAPILNRFAVGVGVGVREVEDAHEVFRFLLEGHRDDFIEKVARKIRQLPGLGAFDAMERLYDRVFATQA